MQATPLVGVYILWEYGLADEGNLSQAYRIARLLPKGVRVQIGRRVKINRLKLDELIAAGGCALPGGWRREPKRTGDAT
jgi:hypothetical protein